MIIQYPAATLPLAFTTCLALQPTSFLFPATAARIAPHHTQPHTMAPSNHPATDGLARMRRLEKSLRELPESETTLSEQRLKTLKIQRAPQLNLDNPDALDGSPVFFQPLDDSAEFRKTFMDTVKEFGHYGICPYKKEHVDRLACATQTLSWFHSAARAVYPRDHPEWLGARQVVPCSS